VLQLMREAGNTAGSLVRRGVPADRLPAGRTAEARARSGHDRTGREGRWNGLFSRWRHQIAGADQTKNDTCRVTTLSADLAKQLKAIIATGSLPKADRGVRCFKVACNRAGYTGNLVIHSLRHTRNTRLRKAGIDKDIRKQLLGHMSDEANDIYDHVDLADLLEADEKVQEHAGKGSKRPPRPMRKWLIFLRLVPVERIELPTFGLQNRLLTGCPLSK
jgi:hypothetical protein